MLLPEDFLSLGEKLFLADGPLSQQEGFDQLFKAFAGVSVPEYPSRRLVILGLGSERDLLERQLNALGLQAQVLLPRRAGNIAQWYARAELFVLSSRYVGFLNVLAHAFALAKADDAMRCCWAAQARELATRFHVWLIAEVREALFAQMELAR